MSGRVQNATLLAARLLMAAALLPTGIARALNVSGFAVTLTGAGLPYPNALATAAVVVQVFGPLALILGVLPRLTGLAMAGFVATLVALLHPFWLYTGASAVTERTLLLADLGLAGAFLVYAVAGPGGWSWQGWRSGRALPVRAADRPRSKPVNGNRAPKRPAGRAPAREAA